MPSKGDPRWHQINANHQVNGGAFGIITSFSGCKRSEPKPSIAANTSYLWPYLVGGAEVIDGAMVTAAQDQWMEMPGDVIAMGTYPEVTIEAWYTPEAGANTTWKPYRLFDGMIDEVRIYNRALSDAEVLYLAGK
jgi:hypothetical protein